MWLMPFLLLASQAWALGLGEIRLSSALNEPMLAEIALLAATPEEIENLKISLAAEETFSRYDLDRPLFLTRLRFEIIRSGRADGNFVRVTSSEPVTEPFVTFLVEASWSRGRLLREYTILLDPPTFAPPPVTQSTQAVTAPSRAVPADAGRIQRPAPQQQAQPAPTAARPSVQAPVQSRVEDPATQQPATTRQSAPTQGRPEFDETPGGDVLVQRGDTLWGISQRVRPDSRLTINQTMLAIFEANPEAFAGNINVMRAGATLRIPSADDVFRISRGDAFAEVQRQNNAWGGRGQAGVAPVEAQPSLTLVPPDEEDDIGLTDDSINAGQTNPVDDALDDQFVDPVASRINEIEGILQDQDALIQIPDNELAALRTELAELRGEEPPVDADDALGVDDEILADDETVADVVSTVPPVVTSPARDEGIVDKIIGYASNFWFLVIGALVVTVLILFWFMRRAANRDDEDVTGVWDALDADDMDTGSEASTERLRALARHDKDSIVVVETRQEPDLDDVFGGDTLETPFFETPEAPASPPPAATSSGAGTGTNKTLEDTFSSETAINLDQSDPVAEADFHMAYGLYDQAADLINGALKADPDRQDLLSKLCEIYFVWGNRDAFIDAAGRLRTAVGGGSNPDWDKTVIMGQQIAGDHELFSGVSAEGATRAVDLSFDAGSDASAELDIDFAGETDSGGSDVINLGGDDDDIFDLGGNDDDVIDLGSGADDVVDLGGDSYEGASLSDTGQVSISPQSGSAIDFSVDDPDIEASITREMPQRGSDETAGMPILEDRDDESMAETQAADDTMASTVETPTIEQQFEMEATGAMPALSESDFAIPEVDATAEINLDDLGLDIADLEEVASGSDFAGDHHLSDLEDTTESQTLKIDDNLAATGSNPEFDDDMLGATGRNPALSDDDATQLASLDDYGEDTDVGIDTSLLDATGQTQILTEDMAVETGRHRTADLSNDDATMLADSYGDDDTIDSLPDEAATLLAPLDDDDDGDFDFAKTEALPKDVFSSDMSTDETGRMPGLAGSTDMDLDLDDLTAALKVSEVGDTVNQTRDDATVEQPRLRSGAPTMRNDTGGTGITQSLAPEDLSGDLHEARTMTEVGTKLDLARAYVDMGDPGGARSILEEVLDEGDQGQKQQAQQLLDSLPS
jgi:pilus assembly protein FimV